MRRFVPKTYHNRRLLRIIFRTVVIVSISALVLFIVLFFALDEYIIPNDDGSLRLEIPWLMEESAPP